MTFKPFNYAQAVGAGTQNALGQAQFMGAAKDFKRQNALEGAFKQASETGEDPAAMLEQQGFGMEANALRQQGLQRAVSGLDWLAKAAPRVGPATYGKFKQQAEQFGIADPGELPDEFDPDLMKTLAGNAQQQWETLMGPRGTLLQRNAQTGQLQQVVGQEPKGNVTNIDMGGNAEQKKYGEFLVSNFDTINSDAAAAEDNLSNLYMAKNIDVQTGALEPAKAWAVSLAEGMGFDAEKYGIQSATNAQAFDGIIQNLVLTKMQAQKGPQTENDAKRIESAVASLGNTPQAREFLTDAAIALEQRTVEQRDFFLDYRQQNPEKSFDGAQKAWSQYKSKTPLLASNPKTGRPVFFYQFREAVMQANPGATEEQVTSLWREKYGRAD